MEEICRYRYLVCTKLGQWLDHETHGNTRSLHKLLRGRDLIRGHPEESRVAVAYQMSKKITVSPKKKNLNNVIRKNRLLHYIPSSMAWKSVQAMGTAPPLVQVTYGC